MAKRQLPTPEQLRQLLRYAPETGKLFWRKRSTDWFHGCPGCTRTWNKKWSGKEALTANGHGYRRGAVLGQSLLAHRVIVALETGAWPDGTVDHIDGDRANNRWSNLRVVSDRENSRNQQMRGNNTSGVVGVSWAAARGKWTATINGEKQINLGRFDRFEDAVAARKAAEVQHGYHENHGRRGHRRLS